MKKNIQYVCTKLQTLTPTHAFKGRKGYGVSIGFVDQAHTYSDEWLLMI
jgi:hypothetical protein